MAREAENNFEARHGRKPNQKMKAYVFSNSSNAFI